MTEELRPDEFQRALPLYRAAGARFPLISAVLRRSQRGRVFADAPAAPRAAFVVNGFGFACLLGGPAEEFDEGLGRLLAAPGALGTSYLLWYAPPEAWQARLDRLGPDRVRRRVRVRFEFLGDRAGWSREPEAPPPGFELRRLTPELLPATEKFGLDLASRFWSSAEDFAANSLGVCLTAGGEVASLCYAAAVADGLAEVDVATQAEYRGRGLAGFVTREFIRGCLRRGVAPTWDCFDYNAGSLRLAEGLGFAELRRYPFYSFNVPAAV
jgi:RimJ/RimL family protein N-acetyltransferase